jgi:hypothetical protein
MKRQEGVPIPTPPAGFYVEDIYNGTFIFEFMIESIIYSRTTQEIIDIALDKAHYANFSVFFQIVSMLG